MSQFTLLLARLVDLLGAESAANVVREFAGQTIQFPVTDHYGLSTNAAVIGADYEPQPKDHTAQPSQIALHRLSELASLPREGRLLALHHELIRQSQALHKCADSLELARSIVLAEIGFQQRDLVGA